MKRNKLERTGTINEDKVTITTTIEDEYEQEELLRMITQREQTKAKLENDKKTLEESIEKKTWIESLDDFNKAINSEEEFIKLLNEVTKPYLEKLHEQGISKVEFKKKEESYDRLPSDAKEKKNSIKNKILNDVREELGLKDMAHSVMMRLRHEAFKEE